MKDEDDTCRKRIKEKLRKSEEKWLSLVNILPDYISLLDLEGRFLFLNHYAEGFTEKEVIGTSTYQYFSPESKEIFKKEMAECQNTKKMRKFEHIAMGDHGIMEKYEDYLVPLLENNQVTSVMVISRDITERKQGEESIKHLNLVLRAIRNINQLIFKEKDRERLIKGVCNSLTETRGYYSSFIVLLDEKGKIDTYAEAGLGKDFLPMLKRLKKGELTDYFRSDSLKARGGSNHQRPGICLPRLSAGTGVF